MASSHSNSVILSAPFQHISYVEGSFQITSGQPATLPPTISHGSNGWTITINCGRKPSGGIADNFNTACGGETHEYAPAWGGGTPNDLSFFFAVKGDILLDEELFSITLYLGQGQAGANNNWWIGGENISNPSGNNKNPVFTISKGPRVFTWELSGSVYEFDFVLDSSASKGIDMYAFVGVGNGSVNFTKPTNQSSSTQYYPFNWVKGDPLPIQESNTQMSVHDVGFMKLYGKFWWEAMVGNEQVGSEFWEIAPLTGSMATGVKDSPTNLMKQRSSYAKGGWGLSFGFYDAGNGFGAAYNQDQSWVYLTEDVSNWMGKLTHENPGIASAPFNSFVLPGAHDAGTYDASIIRGITNIVEVVGDITGAGVTLAMLEQNTSFLGVTIATINAMMRHVGGTELVLEICKKALQNFAVTQTNNATMMLNMGVRYFDFRPGYCLSGIKLTGIYHQHAFVPFATYESFLQEVFAWLAKNPTEIAVVSANFQGFAQTRMQPTVETLDGIVAQAQKAAGAGTIVLGGPDDLSSSYNDLIAANKRLIFLNQIDPNAPEHSVNNTVKYDSYNSTTYATTNPADIIGALNGMNQAGQEGADYTVLQLQGTASTANGVAPAVVLDNSWAGSPLMMTKANFDQQTYAWVVNNVRKNLGSDQLIVLLNDFCDNALAVCAMQIMAGE